jgi:hypothetical protein
LTHFICIFIPKRQINIIPRSHSCQIVADVRQDPVLSQLSAGERTFSGNDPRGAGSGVMDEGARSEAKEKIPPQLHRNLASCIIVYNGFSFKDGLDCPSSYFSPYPGLSSQNLSFSSPQPQEFPVVFIRALLAHLLKSYEPAPAFP